MNDKACCLAVAMFDNDIDDLNRIGYIEAGVDLFQDSVIPKRKCLASDRFSFFFFFRTIVLCDILLCLGRGMPRGGPAIEL